MSGLRRPAPTLCLTQDLARRRSRRPGVGPGRGEVRDDAPDLHAAGAQLSRRHGVDAPGRAPAGRIGSSPCANHPGQPCHDRLVRVPPEEQIAIRIPPTTSAVNVSVDVSALPEEAQSSRPLLARTSARKGSMPRTSIVRGPSLGRGGVRQYGNTWGKRGTSWRARRRTASAEGRADSPAGMERHPSRTRGAAPAGGQEVTSSTSKWLMLAPPVAKLGTSPAAA
jgi:hypothetical protein